MHKMLGIGIALIGASALAGVALAAAPAPTAQVHVARYAFQKAGDGVARLDTQTGEVSYCSVEAPVGLVCRLAPDDRLAYEHQLATLAQENADLRVRLKLPAYGYNAAPPVPQTKKQADAAEQIDLVEYIMKRMIHALRDVATDTEVPPPHTAPPPSAN
jgi:hypothetical protein